MSCPPSKVGTMNLKVGGGHRIEQKTSYILKALKVEKSGRAHVLRAPIVALPLPLN